MNKKLLILLLIFALILGGAAILYNSLAENYNMGNLGNQQNTTELQLAPDFTVYDADGNAAALSDYAGKPVVLNFWTSWCGPCQMEMPHFQSKYEELGEDVQFLMINVTNDSRETLDTAKQFIADAGYSFPVFYDVDDMARQAYGIYSYPTTFFIDADGYLVAYGQGAMDADTLQHGIDMAAIAAE